MAKRYKSNNQSSRKLFQLPPAKSVSKSIIPTNSRWAVKPSKVAVAKGIIQVGMDAYANMEPAKRAQFDQAVRDGTAKVIKETGNKFKRIFRSKGESKDMSRRSFSFSKAPVPSSISIDSGIDPSAYSNDYSVAIDQVCSPLHMNCGRLTIPTWAGNGLSDYFKNVVCFDLQTRAQSNVSFNLNTTTIFNATNITTAMNDLIYALELYLYNKSITTFYDKAVDKRKNEGMAHLRFSIDAETIGAMDILERILNDTPTPPNLLKILRFLSGNFYSGDNQGATIIKICPIPYNNNDTTPIMTASAAQLEAAFKKLVSGTNAEIFSLLRRAVPQWVPKQIYDVPEVPVFSKDFITVFNNLPFVVSPQIQGLTLCPAVATMDTPIAYNSFNDGLDGVAFALTGMYIGANAGYTPGLMMPVFDDSEDVGSENLNTRISYAKSGIVTRFFASKNTPFLTRSRLDTYQVNDLKGGFVSSHTFGGERIVNVTGNTVYETATKAIIWMMSLDSVQTSTRGRGGKR